MTVTGIDVYEGDGDLDWKALRAHGVRFAWQKVNEGDYLDPSATIARVHAARAAGVLIGGYDFLRPKPGRSGAQEFAIFEKRAKAVGLLSRGVMNLNPVLDVEATGYGTNAWGRIQTRRYIKSWVGAARKAGYTPIVYTAAWFWDDTIRCGDTFGCALWVASYARDWEAGIPKAWGHASFHQWTDQGVLPGAKHKLDVDRYLGTWPQLLRHHIIG